MLFVVHYRDHPDVEMLRQTHRAAHIEFRKGLGEALRLAGPLLNDEGKLIGSLVLLETADRAEAISVAERDPYVAAGVFAEVEVTQFRVAFANLPAA
jgi:uncharacterized protein